MIPLMTGRCDDARELEFEIALTQALAAGDDVAVFRLVRSHPDERLAYQVLAEKAGRATYRSQRRQVFTELLFIPVVERHRGSVIENRETWAGAEGCLSGLLDDWLPRGTRKTVFRNVRSLAYVTSWSPSVSQRHLLPADLGGGGRIPLLVQEPELPPEAPRLGFISVAVARTGELPELPAPDTLRDARFRTVLAQSLNAASLQPPEVLAPDQMQYAISDGINLWLAMLNEVMPIVGWSLSLGGACDDTLTVAMRLQADQRPCTDFRVRRHQLGDAGVDCVVATLRTFGAEDLPVLRH